MNTEKHTTLIPTMIVEDEKLILEDIVSLADWNALGFEIVATAYTGEQGMNLFEKHRPSLILTDIKMPGMDGLDMMKSIKNLNPHVHFIVISSYSDFEYAQTAMRLGASDYILKGSISSDYISQKLLGIKELYTNTQELYLSLYQKLLMDLADAQDIISMNVINSLFDRLNPDDLHTHFDTFTEEAFEIIEREYEKIRHKSFEPPVLHNIDELKEWLLTELNSLKRTHQLYFEKQLSPTLIKAYNYISEHYSNPDLHIEEIAEEVGLSASRLSVLYKQETGKTVNQILTEKRMETAKYLLRWKNKKVYEVSELVGYKTSSYFSKVFYQYTGQYPNAYREEE